MPNKTLKEMAAELGKHPRTLRRILAETPDVTYLKVGRDILFRPVDVERLMNALTVSSRGALGTQRGTVATVTVRGIKPGLSTARERVLLKTQKPPRKVPTGTGKT